jgi:hypothetical protein
MQSLIFSVKQPVSACCVLNLSFSFPIQVALTSNMKQSLVHRSFKVVVLEAFPLAFFGAVSARGEIFTSGYFGTISGNAISTSGFLKQPLVEIVFHWQFA